MKNLVKRSIVIALSFCMVFSGTVLADPLKEDPSKLATSVYASKASNKITVAVKASESTVLNVKIYDEDGNHIFTDKVSNTDGFLRTYDLNENGPGEYTVKVSNESVVSTKTVSVGEQKAAFKAYFSSKFKDNKIKVSYYNANSPANVIVYDNRGKEVAREVISTSKDFSSFVNLGQLSRGDYTLRIDSNGQGIEKSIYVK